MPHKDPEAARQYQREYKQKKYRTDPIYRAKDKARKAKHPGNCLRCGKAFRGRRPTAKFCSRRCSAKWMWETKQEHRLRRQAKGKYRYKRVNGKKTPAHRVIMEEHLGRSLRDDEMIHHINLDRGDNRIENLQIVTKGEHANIHLKLSQNRTK